ncbi:MAG: DUF1800 domain-containing protein [Armatimonadota bacterium]|nr:DUF1800 domain-containing protein [Armatimonadota bacterium]
MTNEEKIAHLLRRFGLGASYAEMEFYGKLGVDGTIDRLIEYDQVPSGFDVSLLRFAVKDREGREVLRMPAVVAWWTLRMLSTHRPMQEKLTLFWHDHFAVSASKVNVPLMMSGYLDTLHKGASGKFRDLLLSVSRDPAMIRWLDNETNVKGRPNENFAREILELFTLGIGNYTESDVLEAARAFTGWAFAASVDRREAARQGKRRQELVFENAKAGKPAFVFQFRPRQHDTGVKKVLENEGPFGGEDLCDILAVHPKTASHLSKKLWEWFCYMNPEEAIVNRLSKKFLDNGTAIKPVLHAIAESDEFWSDKCVRRQVKNPVDFTLAVFRQLGLGPISLRTLEDSANERAALASARGADVMMERQGMQLLFPPDVDGWEWGEAWVSSATMIERIKVADGLFKGAAQKGLVAVAAIGDKPARNSRQIVDALLAVVDAKLPEEKYAPLVAACEDAGGSGAMRAPQSVAKVANAVYRVLFASPEFQFC